MLSPDNSLFSDYCFCCIARVLGLRPPIVSWGVMLNEAQNMNVVVLYPWLLLPVVPVICVILAFNFMGDGLRDASDPYSS